MVLSSLVFSFSSSLFISSRNVNFVKTLLLLVTQFIFPYTIDLFFLFSLLVIRRTGSFLSDYLHFIYVVISLLILFIFYIFIL